MWKSNGISEENIGDITKSGSNCAPTLVGHQLLPDVNFCRHCLMKKKFTIPKKVINLYISYTLTAWLRNLDTYFPLDNCLFGSVKLTKNSDPDKYMYSSYAIWFDLRLEFLLFYRSIRRSVIFRADRSSSVHVDNKNKDILYYSYNRSKISY